MKEVTEKGKHLRSLNIRIKEKTIIVESLRKKAESSGINYDKIGTSGSNNNSAESKIITYLDKVAELNILCAEKAKLASEFEQLLESKYPDDKSSTRRTIYSLYYSEGLSAKKVAEALDCAVGTVRNYIAYEN